MVYHSVLVSYLASARERGFEKAELWACGPERRVDYILLKGGNRPVPKTDTELCRW